MERDLNLQRIAVLIDADNSQLIKLNAIIDEISTYGRIVVKKAYGDWKNPGLKNWEDVLKSLAIKPEQQFSYTKGKNATDIALVIDAMDLLSAGIYDAFALVSSDSDYTPLAIRLRESGVYIFGAGEDKTPSSFIKACDNFINTKTLITEEEVREKKQPSVPNNHVAVNDIVNIHHLLQVASEKYSDDDGWVNISSAGTYIKRLLPDFDVRSFGFVKLPDLLKAYPQIYEITKFPGKGTVNIIAYRVKI